MIDDAQATVLRPLLTEAEAAAYLRMGPESLGNKRRAGMGPPCIKLFGVNSPALYRMEALEAWVLSRESGGSTPTTTNMEDRSHGTQELFGEA